MTDRANLISFIGVLATIIILAIIAATTGKPDAQIISAVMTGLIGVLGTFRPRAPAADNGAVIAAIDKIPPVTTTEDSPPDAVAVR